jgi:phytanoyl-CoA hydroxylase
MVAVQHYLDDGTRENGCICFVPGSHRWGLLPPSRSPGRDQPDFFGADKVVEVPVRAGSAAFFHAMTFHFSGHNTSPRPRRCPIIQYFAPPTRFRLASGDDQPDLPFGERLVAR